MPSGYHPCFRRAAWDAALGAVLQFDSDGWIYRYSTQTYAELETLMTEPSPGGKWNLVTRSAWGSYLRIADWPDGLDPEWHFVSHHPTETMPNP